MPVPPDQKITREERTNPTGLYHYAESYRDCADELRANPPRRLMFDAPIAFLYYHAAELYMKAWLRHAGVPLERLWSKELGHDLRALKDECISLGLPLNGYPDVFFDFVDRSDVMGARYIVTGA